MRASIFIVGLALNVLFWGVPVRAVGTTINLEIQYLDCSNDLVYTGVTIETHLYPEVCKKALDQTTTNQSPMLVQNIPKQSIGNIRPSAENTPNETPKIAPENTIAAVAEVLGITDLDTTETKILTYATIPVGLMGLTMISNDYFSRSFRDFVRRRRR